MLLFTRALVMKTICVTLHVMYRVQCTDCVPFYLAVCGVARVRGCVRSPGRRRHRRSLGRYFNFALSPASARLTSGGTRVPTVWTRVKSTECQRTTSPSTGTPYYSETTWGKCCLIAIRCKICGCIIEENQFRQVQFCLKEIKCH